MIIGVIMQCAGTSIGLFIGGRFVVGFGITLALAAAPILISELAHPRHRVFFGSLYNTSFYLGSLLAGSTTFGSYRIPNAWAWRLPTLFQAAPAVLQVTFVFFLDESPRWLYYKDRGEEAYRMRAMGISLLVFANKAALFFSHFVNPIGMDALGWRFYLVYVGWLAIKVVVFWLAVSRDEEAHARADSRGVWR
ncbi:hypothetical protein ACHAQH_004313 [Verticillium albo-atrum]